MQPGAARLDSILEYASVVWNSDSVSNSEALEKVQKRFLRYLYFRTHNFYPHYLLHPVRTVQLLQEFDFLTLKRRREIADCLFIYKVLHNAVDCSFILSLLNFRVNVHNTSSQDLLYLSDKQLAPFHRMMSSFNGAGGEVDPLVCSLVSFRRHLRSQTGPN